MVVREDLNIKESMEQMELNLSNKPFFYQLLKKIAIGKLFVKCTDRN